MCVLRVLSEMSTLFDGDVDVVIGGIFVVVVDIGYCSMLVYTLVLNNVVMLC